MVWVVWVFLWIIIPALLQRCRIHSSIWMCCSRVLQIIFKWAPALSILPIQKSLSLKQTLKPLLWNPKGAVICLISHKLPFTILVIAKTSSFWISQSVYCSLYSPRFCIWNMQVTRKDLDNLEHKFCFTAVVVFLPLSFPKCTQHSHPA